MSTRKKKTSADILATGDVLTPPAGNAKTESESRVLHVNGKAIPEAFAHAIPYDMTDEGIAEANERRAEPSGVKLGAGPWEKNLQRREDLADEDNVSREIWEGTDPMVGAINEFGKAGMAHRFLSPDRVRSKGLRNWKPVTAPNGDPVKVGNMILGEMPEAKKRQRDRYYSDLSREAVEENAAQIQDIQEKIIRDGGIGRDQARALRRGEMVGSNDPDGGVEIGMSRSRGTRA